MLQKNSDETAVARFSRSFGGPGPHVFDFTCSSTTGKAQNAPVLASKARLKRFVSNSFATLGLSKVVARRGQDRPLPRLLKPDRCRTGKLP